MIRVHNINCKKEFKRNRPIYNDFHIPKRYTHRFKRVNVKWIYKHIDGVQEAAIEKWCN